MAQCASCGAATSKVMDFGAVALAGAFLKPQDFGRERKYPLSLHFCEECYLLQVPERVQPRELFEDYFYFSSAIGTLKTHFALYANEIVDRFKPDSVLEIGCNDGVLLKPLADAGVRRIVGVDPAKNVTAKIDDERIEVINAYFGEGIVPGPIDVVVANNVFAHIGDIRGATRSISRLIGKTGVFIFEVNRLDDLIYDTQYDWIYHEHLYYYSSLALDRLLGDFGLEIFDLKRIGTHAGSIRYYACAKGTREKTIRVEEQHEKDLWHGLAAISRFEEFAEKAQAHRERMIELVRGAKAAGKTVAGYGACGRANTMLQWCGFTAEDFDFIVDDAPAKHGFYTPGSHIPIVPNSALTDRQPDLLIVFAWSFLNEIQTKFGDYRGEIIVPLPDIYKVQERLAA